MNLDDINMKEIKPSEVDEVVSELDDDEEKEEFKEKYSEMIEEKYEESKPEEQTKDKWLCVSCGSEFELERGEEPLKCEGTCGKNINKTKFKALTGPFKYFQKNPMTGRTSFSPMILGEDIIDQHQIITDDTTEEIYVWKGNYYSNEGERFIKKKAQKRLHGASSTSMKNKVVDWIMHDEKTSIPTDEFNKNPHMVGVENGVLDTKNRKLEDPDPEKHIITTKIPVEYDPEAKFEDSNIKEFLGEVFYEEDLPTIQEYLGTILFKTYDFKKAMVLVGPTNTGKSTFLKLVERFIGEENCSSETLKKLCDKDFRKVNLFGKMANMGKELTAVDKIRNTDVFKSLVGGDTVSAEKKHVQETKEFENFAKLMFSCNDLPRISKMDDAWWGRWLILTVDKNEFSEGEDDRVRQKKLMDRLTEPEEFSALLNWALDGLERVMKNDEFTVSERTERGKEKWIRQTDSLRAFVNLHCERDKNGRLVKKKLYGAYTQYCEEENLSAIDSGQVGKNLPTILKYVSSKKPKIHYDGSHKQMKCWENIKFKEDSKFSKYNREINRNENKQLKDDTNEDQRSLDVVYDDQDDTPNKVDQTLEDIIKTSILHLSDGSGVSKRLVIDLISEDEDLDYSKDDISKALDGMKTQGRIMEPKEGRYKLV